MNHLPISPSTDPQIFHLTVFIYPLPASLSLHSLTYLHICWSISSSIHPSIHPTNCSSIHLPIFIQPPVHQSVHLPIYHPLTHVPISHPPTSPSIHPYIHLAPCPSTCPMKANHHNFLFKVFQISETFTNTIFFRNYGNFPLRLVRKNREKSQREELETEAQSRQETIIAGACHQLWNH